MMGDALFCFTCCIAEQPQPKRPRRRLDPSMIGLPTDFRHTTHIGSNEVGNSMQINSLQNQMSSKGDHFDPVSPCHLKLSVVDLPHHRSPS
ncbi:CDC42 small effector protein 2-like [Gigantopelta aegis]|uniref:CDC42 small effector protein 2-like n=1 Tax=Gigantopelta aegis TaxID=1735272 RepID=UPI001B88C658|nr:CDC42 small effector protein 2-like [Gigantopelta aegis]